MKMNNHKQFRIAICGGIAVGKTTIGKQLTKHLEDGHFIEEDPRQNSYLKEFYLDKKKWGFHSRIAMLALFIDYYNSASQLDKTYIVFDRTIHELITFARLQYFLGNLTKNEYKLYKQLYNSVLSLTKPMDLVIYLYCDPLVSLNRIQKRGREFESSVDEKYLLSINHQYDIWLRLLKNKTSIIKIDTSSEIDLRLLGAKIRDIQKLSNTHNI